MYQNPRWAAIFELKELYGLGQEGAQLRCWPLRQAKQEEAKTRRQAKVNQCRVD